MRSLRDKVIIVTGASSGIGLASARQFGREGARVVMAARSLDRMLALAPGVADPDRVLCVRCDVTREEDCRALVEATLERWGRINVLVNNAGISMRAMFKDLDLQVIGRLMGHGLLYEICPAAPARFEGIRGRRGFDRGFLRVARPYGL